MESYVILSRFNISKKNKYIIGYLNKYLWDDGESNSYPGNKISEGIGDIVFG